MPRIFVGVSEYGSLRGTQQFLEERAGLQFLAVLAIVNPQLPPDERITFNECERPRPSQSAFWNDYVRRGAPPAVVAARPFTSKHDGGPTGDRALAADLGGPGGAVITDRAHALFKAVALEYGIHHTGAGFRPAEKWHFQYVPGTARKLASAGPTQQEQEQQHMTARNYRDKKTGETRTIDVSTGKDQYLEPGYPELHVAMGIVPGETIQVETNQMQYLRQAARATRQAIAAEVWGQAVPGWNGPQTAAARLAGIDQKAGTAKVDGAGLKVTVDETSITNKVVAGVRGLFQKAGS